MVINHTKILLLCFLLGTLCKVFAISKVDSLELELQKSINDEKRLMLYIKLFKENHDSSGCERLKKYKSDAVRIAKKLNDSLYLFEIEYQSAFKSLDLLELDQAKKSFTLCEKISRSLKNDTLELRVLYGLGIYHFLNQDYVESHKSMKKVIFNSHLNDMDPAFQARLYCNLGNSYLNMGDEFSCLKFYLKSLDISLTHDIRDVVHINYLNIGYILYNQKNYEKAKEFLTKGIHYQESNEEPSITHSYYYLGLICEARHNYINAIGFFEKAISKSQTLNFNVSVTLFKLQIAENYLKLNKVEKAYEIFNKITSSKFSKPLEIAQAKIKLAHCLFLLENKTFTKEYFDSLLTEFDSDSDLAELYKDISTYFKLIDDLDNAIYYLERVFEIIQQITVRDNNSLELDVIEALSSSYFKQGNLKKAHFYDKEYIKLYKESQEKSSLIFLQSEQLLQEFVSKKHLLDKALIEKEKATLKKNNYILGVSAVGVFLFLSLVFTIFYLKYKQRILEQNIENKLNTNRIESIIYGEEEERKQMSYFIHEKLSQDLISAKYNLNHLEPKTQSDTQKISLVKTCLDSSLSKLREITFNLAPPTIDFMNIADILESYCEEVSNTNNLKISFEYQGSPLKLDQKRQIAIYRIIQELLTNVIEHSKAKKALVMLRNFDNQVTIIVEDNGIGGNEWQEGFGWKKIKYRMSVLNAIHKINSDANGTSIQIQLTI